MAEITAETQAARTKAMRALSDEQRREAIDASPNVIGFERFWSIAHQRNLADGYRRS